MIATAVRLLCQPREALLTGTTWALLALSGPAPAADFINLDFEQAQAPTLQPNPFALLDWSTAAPGWSHSAGADTGSVYYGTVHLGVTQWFALTGDQSFPQWRMGGRYGLAFTSGYAASSGPNSPWVQATLSQTGTVPVGTRSLTLQALGPLAIYLGDTRIALQSLGGNLYGGDVSAWSGQTLELKLVNLSSAFGGVVAVDDIVFSPLALVPEPPGAGLLTGGLLAMAAVVRRRRRAPAA